MALLWIELPFNVRPQPYAGGVDMTRTAISNSEMATPSTSAPAAAALLDPTVPWSQTMASEPATAAPTPIRSERRVVRVTRVARVGRRSVAGCRRVGRTIEVGRVVRAGGTGDCDRSATHEDPSQGNLQG